MRVVLPKLKVVVDKQQVVVYDLRILKIKLYVVVDKDKSLCAFFQHF